MPDTNEALLVPIDVRALCVSAADAERRTIEFAGALADFSRLPYRDRVNFSAHYAGGPANTGDNIRTGLFPPKEPLAAGVHLHWALPDALTKAETAATGEQRFLPVPDRWLVTRIVGTSTGLAMRAWVVESDHLMDEDEYATYYAREGRPSVCVPVGHANGTRPYRYLGRVFDAATYQASATSDAERFADLTALGYGDVLFAAYYPECRSVFGFYDALDDAELPTIIDVAYSVVGWYSDAGRDPLRRLDAVTPLNVRDRYNWSYTSGAATPALTYCHGAVYDLRFDRAASTCLAASHSVETAVGNTAAEALSALLAARVESGANAEHVEYMLDAIQLGMTAQLGESAGALAKLEAALHASGFAPGQGGYRWGVKKDEGSSSGGDDEILRATAADLAAENELPDSIAQDLHVLNAVQQEYDRAWREIRSLRERIYADWHRYMDATYPSAGPPLFAVINLAYEYIQQEIALLDRRVAAAGRLDFDEATGYSTASTNVSVAGRLIAALRDLETKIAAAKAETGAAYRLRRVVAGRFYRPNDPVVLLRGLDMQPSTRYGGDHRFSPDGTLLCRLSTETASALRVRVGADTREIDAAGIAPPAFAAGIAPPAFAAADEYRAIFARLVRETILLEPRFANALHATNAAGPDVAVIANAQEHLLAMIQATIDGSNPYPDLLRANERAPSVVGVHRYRAPYLALFLYWRAHYRPVADEGHDYPTDFLMQRLVSGDRIDPVFSSALPDPATTALEPYEGRALLAPRAAVQLKKELEEILLLFPDSPLASVADDLLQLPLLAQAIDGFHESLLMRESTLQLKIEDPLALDPPGREFSDNLVRGAVAGENVLAPAPYAAFNPIRGGSLQFTRLRVVDTFGQVREIPATRPTRSHLLSPPGATADADAIYLPPRLAQPARLNFRWVSALDDQLEMNDHPATSPVCGWLLPNHLSGGAAVYSRAGQAFGQMQLSGDEASIIWEGAPGAGYANRADVPWSAARSEHLGAFVLNVVDGQRAAFLKDFLRVVDRTLSTIEPAAYAREGLAVLIGRPLAVVRAVIELELDGLPALNLSHNAFETALRQHASAPRDERGFTAVRFPVRLGELNYAADGLIGYFIENADGPDYGNFYAAAADRMEHGVIAPNLNTLTLDLRSRLTVTMIIDPRCPVHATTGILPVKSIDVPVDQYGPALERMAVSFPVRPVLTAVHNLFVPTPREPGYAWEWVGPPGRPTPALAPPPAAFAELRLREGWLRLRPAADRGRL